ncbi:MAG: hypothetical protein ACPF8V_00065 [Luteibaculum sp.]
MKKIYTQLFLAVCTFFIVACAEDPAEPTPAQPNGTVSQRGVTSNLFKAYKGVEVNVDISPDSSGEYFHDLYQLIFIEQELRSDTVIITAPGSAVFLLSIYTPAGSGLQNGSYRAANNVFCHADSANQALFCEAVFQKDLDGDLMINQLETLQALEGIVKISGEGANREFKFVGNTADQIQFTMEYRGEPAELKASFTTF